MNEEQPPTYREPERCEYIIDLAALRNANEALRGVRETLEPFSPMYLRHAPFATVSVTRERERELIDTLRAIDGVTYRRAEARRAFDDMTSIDDTVEKP